MSNEDKKEDKRWDDIHVPAELIEGTSEKKLPAKSKSEAQILVEAGVNKPDLIAPKRPGLLQHLVDWKAGKIAHQAFLDKWKAYYDAEMDIFMSKTKAAIQSHDLAAQAAVHSVEEALSEFSARVIAGTEERRQAIINDALVRIQENLIATLNRLADADGPPEVIAASRQQAVEAWKEAALNIRNRRWDDEKDAEETG